MQIRVTHVSIYDTDDKEFWQEYLEYMGDHVLRFSGLQEFIVDRFINPNFDKGHTEIEIVE